MKAVFITGIPGAGKSYTVSKLKGTVSPIVINTDRAVEFISKKDGVESTSETWRSVFADRSKRITSEMLQHAINGMLPLFVDGTSNNASTILLRKGILEACGYDVGMIFINTSLEVAIQRAEERAKKINRHVDPNFIRSVYQKSVENKPFFEANFQFFEEVNNDPGELDDEMLGKLFNKCQSFFAADLSNPIGKRFIKELKEVNGKYLSDIHGQKWIDIKTNGWYANF